MANKNIISVCPDVEVKSTVLHTGGGCWVDYICLELTTNNPDEPEKLFVGLALTDETVMVSNWQDTPGLIDDVNDQPGYSWGVADWLFNDDPTDDEYAFANHYIFPMAPPASEQGIEDFCEYNDKRKSRSFIHELKVVSPSEIYITLVDGNAVVVNAETFTFKPHTVEEYFIFDGIDDPDEMGLSDSQYLYYKTNPELCDYNRVYVEALADGDFHILVGNISNIWANLQEAENDLVNIIYGGR